MPDTDSQGARTALQRFVSELRLALGSVGLDVTCSIGAVTMTTPTESSAELLAAADALMYDVKRGGKGGIAYREYQGDA
jgi:GGDEF domain-containing protein